MALSDEASVNGTGVGSDPNEFNYFAPADEWDISGALVNGANELHITVDNWARPGGNAWTNPGGLTCCVEVELTWSPVQGSCD